MINEVTDEHSIQMKLSEVSYDLEFEFDDIIDDLIFIKKMRNDDYALNHINILKQKVDADYKSIISEFQKLLNYVIDNEITEKDDSDLINVINNIKRKIFQINVLRKTK